MLMEKSHKHLIFAALQYSNWSETIFSQMNKGGVAAVHVTICYHEDFDEMIKNKLGPIKDLGKLSNKEFHYGLIPKAGLTR